MNFTSLLSIIGERLHRHGETAAGAGGEESCGGEPGGGAQPAGHDPGNSPTLGHCRDTRDTLYFIGLHGVSI